MEKVLTRTANSSHCNNQLEATVAKLTLNQNAFIQEKCNTVLYWASACHTTRNVTNSSTCKPGSFSTWMVTHTW